MNWGLLPTTERIFTALQYGVRSRLWLGPGASDGPLAQLVEQGTLNPKVEGSNPSRPTRESPRTWGLSRCLVRRRNQWGGNAGGNGRLHAFAREPLGASATERTATAAERTSTEPTTFQPSVAYSSFSPRRLDHLHAI